MNRLRAATPAEIEKIRATSDLDPTCIVLALDAAGTGVAVIRTVIEVDPAHYPENWGMKQIALFTRDIETYLSAKGVPSYYFNVTASQENEPWISSVKTWGAEQVSPSPELRFKKML